MWLVWFFFFFSLSLVCYNSFYHLPISAGRAPAEASDGTRQS